MHSQSFESRFTLAIVCALLMGCGSSGGSATAPDASVGGAAGSQAGSSASTTATAGKTASPGSSGGSFGQSGGTLGGGSTSLTTGGSSSAGGVSTVGTSSIAGSSSSSATSSALGGTGGTASSIQTGGTGGTSRTGGATVSGGTSVGGISASGGSKNTGGTSASGGTTVLGGTTATTGTTGPLPALTIYIAGDSTVSNYTETAATNDQAGWGQMLDEIFNTKVTIDNRAAGGRTAYWFYLEGAADKILNAIKPGDYFFIQFGTNDQNETATFTVDGTTYPRYAEADTTFKTHLKKYFLDPTKAKKAIPVLVTPPPRNSAYCNGGNGLGAYATAMVELGAAENVAVLDNNSKTFNYLKAICPKPTTAAAENFFLGKSDGTIDGTHFQENGARKMAGFIGEEIKRVNLGLAAYLK
jgi:lysophospholipase L1-like esterase